MATTEQPQKSVGTPQIRKEDPELITGRSRYVDDITVPGMLWAHVVRSPFAHARINGVDVSKALAMEGCVAAFSGADLAAEWAAPAGLRLAGHRRHQDERALAARQGQGAPRGRRRRRGGGRDARARQGRRRAGRGRLGAAAGRDRPARRDGGRRPARARRLRHQRVERLGVREGRLARSPQDVQALLRRPRPREGEAPLPAAAAHPERHGAARAWSWSRTWRWASTRCTPPARSPTSCGPPRPSPAASPRPSCAWWPRTWAAASDRSSTRTPRSRSASPWRGG